MSLATPGTQTELDLSIEGERVLGRVRAGLFGADDTPVRIGRFVVLERLGAGGMGEVYLAMDPELDRRVAVKLVRADQDSPQRQDALQKEAQAVARLAHPHVVAVFEVGRADGRVFVAMEYVEGQTPIGRSSTRRGRAWICSASTPCGHWSISWGSAAAARRRAAPRHRSTGPRRRSRPRAGTR